MDCEIQYTRNANLPAGYMAVGLGNKIASGKPAYGADGSGNKDVGCAGELFPDADNLAETGCGAQTVSVATTLQSMINAKLSKQRF